ncbi:MAG: peptidoglycan bridge formation glycyltransferase FemA/FemB family protein [Anaerolineales bacterium]|nr:peptidoglycan bridge formation glycyltransferase FemA/FemB family protein [Anaerolineales bacterium]
MGFQIQVSNEINDLKWNEFVASVPSGHHVQTSLWGQVKAILDWRAERILITEQDGRIVAGAQILMRPFAHLFTVAYITKGPVLAREDSACAEIIIQTAIQIGRENHAQMLAIQPPNNGTAMISLLSECGFESSSLELAPVASIVIDLAPNENQLLSQMKRQTRQNIHRSEREGIAVREGNASDLNIFYSLHIATSQRQKFVPYSLKYFRHLWDVFEPHGYISLFIAEYNHVPISALLTIPFGNTVIAKILGWSGEFSQLRPNDAIFWHAIKWSKLHGYRYFDFEGIDVDGAKAILAGNSLPESIQHSPDFLKLGFGGQVVLYPPAYDMVYNPVFQWIYKKTSPKVGGQSLPSQVLERLRKL